MEKEFNTTVEDKFRDAQNLFKQQLRSNNKAEKAIGLVFFSLTTSWTLVLIHSYLFSTYFDKSFKDLYILTVFISILFSGGLDYSLFALFRFTTSKVVLIVNIVLFSYLYYVVGTHSLLIGLAINIALLFYRFLAPSKYLMFSNEFIDEQQANLNIKSTDLCKRH